MLPNLAIAHLQGRERGGEGSHFLYARALPLTVYHIAHAHYAPVLHARNLFFAFFTQGVPLDM